MTSFELNGSQVVADDGHPHLLAALRDELDRMLRDCAGGDIAHCGVIQTLADHGRCDSEHI